MPDIQTGTQLADGTPERLGRYRLVRPISTGGMARVFEARRESLAGVAPRVAVKVILPDYAKDPGFQELFINEARVGSMLHHPNLVQIQDFDHEYGLFYLVMEFVEGVTLRRTIGLCRRNGIAIPLSVIAEIGRQACDGLHYAHTAVGEDGLPLRLVHRDVKPSNLILNPQGVVKILDFGISKATMSREKRGAVRGTWGYMGPEQARGGTTVGPASDLFGLGSVLFELAELRPLFPEREAEDIRVLLDQDEAARRATALQGAYGPLAGVLVRSLQRDPAARYASAAAMARALGTLVSDPITAREQLGQFQRTISELAQPGVQRQTPSYPSAGSGATLGSAPSAGGLPVAVGSRQAPERRPAPPPVSRGPSPAARVAQAAALAAFMFVAILVIGFTGWQLYVRAAPAPQAPQTVTPPASVKESPLASLVSKKHNDASALAAGDAAEVDDEPDDVTVSSAPATSGTPSAASTSTRAAPRSASQPRSSGASSAASGDLGDGGWSNTPAEPTAPGEPVSGTGTTSATEADSSGWSRKSTGLLTISSTPRAQVILDGQFVRYTPLFRHEVSSGSHLITLIADDGRRHSFKLRVSGGDETRRIWSFDDMAWVE